MANGTYGWGRSGSSMRTAMVEELKAVVWVEEAKGAAMVAVEVSWAPQGGYQVVGEAAVDEVVEEALVAMVDEAAVLLVAREVATVGSQRDPCIATQTTAPEARTAMLRGQARHPQARQRCASVVPVSRYERLLLNSGTWPQLVQRKEEELRCARESR